MQTWKPGENEKPLILSSLPFNDSHHHYTQQRGQGPRAAVSAAHHLFQLPIGYSQLHGTCWYQPIGVRGQAGAGVVWAVWGLCVTHLPAQHSAMMGCGLLCPWPSSVASCWWYPRPTAPKHTFATALAWTTPVRWLCGQHLWGDYMGKGKCTEEFRRQWLHQNHSQPGKGVGASTAPLPPQPNRSVCGLWDHGLLQCWNHAVSLSLQTSTPTEIGGQKSMKRRIHQQSHKVSMGCGFVN